MELKTATPLRVGCRLGYFWVFVCEGISLASLEFWGVQLLRLLSVNNLQISGNFDLVRLSEAKGIPTWRICSFKKRWKRLDG